MNSIYLLNRIVSYQLAPEKFLSCCKQFTVDRKYNIRWKNRIYFRDNRVKIINIKEYDEYYDEDDYIIIYEVWYKNGKRHRDDIDPKTGNTLHASIDDFECKIWYKNGEKYRDDVDPENGLILPAETWTDGSKEWFKDGDKHRDEIDPETGLILPAETYLGKLFWYKDGKLHMNDIDPDTGETLPARIHKNYALEFWTHGKYIYTKDIFVFNL
jgi:hypothetical protein